MFIYGGHLQQVSERVFRTDQTCPVSVATASLITDPYIRTGLTSVSDRLEYPILNWLGTAGRNPVSV